MKMLSSRALVIGQRRYKPIEASVSALRQSHCDEQIETSHTRNFRVFTVVMPKENSHSHTRNQQHMNQQAINETKTEIIHARITKDEMIEVQQKCLKRKITPSDYLREALAAYKQSPATETRGHWHV